MTESTDWNSFYQRRGLVSRLTARLAFRNFMSTLRPFLSSGPEGLTSLVELGGGNSVFYPDLRKTFPAAKLILVDKCAPTEAFAHSTAQDSLLELVEADFLTENPLFDKMRACASLIFSFGLIEHFTEQGTCQVIKRHFDLARPGALIFLSFPTPTPQYRCSRALLERLGLWCFPDERPLEFAEVRAAANSLGDELNARVCHRLGLTQGVLLYRKRGDEHGL